MNQPPRPQHPPFRSLVGGQFTGVGLVQHMGIDGSSRRLFREVHFCGGLAAAVGRAVGRAAGGVQGFAGVGPVEGVGHGLVVIHDERSQLLDEIRDRGEVSATDDFAIDEAEDGLDLVEPRAMFGQVDEPDAMCRIAEERAAAGLVLENSRCPFFFPSPVSGRSVSRSTRPVRRTSECLSSR